jgi:hypothetical protein
VLQDCKQLKRLGKEENMSKLVRVSIIVLLTGAFIYACHVALVKLLAEEKILLLEQKDFKNNSHPTIVICPSKGPVDSKTLEDVYRSEYSTEIVQAYQYST